MAGTEMFINPHSWIAASAWEGAVLAALVFWLAVWALCSSRRRTKADSAAATGLSHASAAFVARALRRVRPADMDELLRSPHRLREHLAHRLTRTHGTSDAVAFAEQAAAVLEELRAREAAFDGAPRAFEMVTVSDALDPRGTTIRAWVVDIDENSLTLVATKACPWPIRRDLHITRLGAGADRHTFTATMVLRPVPGCRDWVLNHDLIDEMSNRRHVARAPCNLTTHTVPPTADVATLREKLRRGESVDMARLRRTEAWPRRHTVLLVDISPAGAGLLADHEVSRHENFHLVLEERGRLLALPLAEVVDVRGAAGGRLALGTRFAGMRLAERVTLADFSRNRERSQQA